MQFLVTASKGPGFSQPQEMIQILEELVIPSLEAMVQMESDKQILAGGLPVGDRAFALMVEAESNEALDKTLRNLPIWGLLEWKVTPLQSLSSRLEIERDQIRKLAM